MREEFGYPIMVTPLSQFVGSQTAINVIVGKRYEQGTDQSIFYALGLWGEEGSQLMHADVKDRILNRPRAKELSRWQPPEPSIAEIRKDMEEPDDLLLRWLVTKEEFAAMKAAGSCKEYAHASQPLLGLLDDLSKRKSNHVFIQNTGLKLSLRRNSENA